MNYKSVSRYGRIAVGQLVNYSAAILAPTNSARPCGCRRDMTTGKIIHPDETVGFEAQGLQDVPHALEAYIAIVDASSPMQLKLAIKEAYRRITNGELLEVAA